VYVAAASSQIFMLHNLAFFVAVEETLLPRCTQGTILADSVSFFSLGKNQTNRCSGYKRSSSPT
jgi:hypothetical protein